MKRLPGRPASSESLLDEEILPDDLSVSADETVALAVPEKDFDAFSPHLIVRAPDGKRFQVAVDAAANRARLQVVLSRMGTIIDKALQDAETVQPEGIDLQRLTTAVSTFVDMSVAVYSPKAITRAANKQSEMATLAVSMARGFAEGATNSAVKSYDERMKTILQLGSVGPGTRSRQRKAPDKQEVVVDA